MLVLLPFDASLDIPVQLVSDLLLIRFLAVTAATSFCNQLLDIIDLELDTGRCRFEETSSLSRTEDVAPLLLFKRRLVSCECCVGIELVVVVRRTSAACAGLDMCIGTLPILVTGVHTIDEEIREAELVALPFVSVEGGVFVPDTSSRFVVWFPGVGNRPDSPTWTCETGNGLTAVEACLSC